MTGVRKALSAFYVIWTNVYGPMNHEPIPFEKEADGKKFLKKHKGKKALKFEDVTLKALHSLDKTLPDNMKRKVEVEKAETALIL